MRTFLTVFCSLLASACQTSEPSASNSTSSPAPSIKANAKGALDAPGIFAPRDAAELSIWTEAWRGELVLLDVVPHGTQVKEGDTIARVDTRAIDEEIHDAELEASSAAVRQRGVVERNKIEDDAAQSAREHARAESERAGRALEGWKNRELDFARRSDEISREYAKNGIDDQVDELDQLEKMYKADELVDATEDIVLKRSRRQLTLSRTSQSLQNEQLQYRVDYDRARDTELREEAAKVARETLGRLIATQEIERAARDDAQKRSLDALGRQQEKLERLRRDRALLTPRAPRAGVLLHGAERDYHPGRAQRIFERGQSLTPRTTVFLVAEPAPTSVSFDLAESALPSVGNGEAVKVRLVGGTGESSGAISVSPYPSAASTSADDGVHEASVKLSQPIAGALYGMRARVVLASDSKDGE